MTAAKARDELAVTPCVALHWTSTCWNALPKVHLLVLMHASVGSKACLLVIQEAQYIPGPWLKEGKNELIFLEVEKSPSEATGTTS